MLKGEHTVKGYFNDLNRTQLSDWDVVRLFELECYSTTQLNGTVPFHFWDTSEMHRKVTAVTFAHMRVFI